MDHCYQTPWGPMVEPPEPGKGTLHGISKPDWIAYLVIAAVAVAAKSVEHIQGFAYTVPRQHLPWAGLLAYLVLGYVGARLAANVRIPGPVSGQTISRRLFMWPVFAGAAFGLALVGLDAAISGAGSSPVPQVGLPESLTLSLVAGITEEILFRLLLVPLVMWVLLRWTPASQTVSFWVSAGVSAALYGAAEAAVLLQAASWQPGIVGMLLVGVGYSLAAALVLRTRGFLAVVFLRMGMYAIWHVLWGAIQ